MLIFQDYCGKIFEFCFYFSTDDLSSQHFCCVHAISSGELTDLSNRRILLIKQHGTPSFKSNDKCACGTLQHQGELQLFALLDYKRST